MLLPILYYCRNWNDVLDVNNGFVVLSERLLRFFVPTFIQNIYSSPKSDTSMFIKKYLLLPIKMPSYANGFDILVWTFFYNIGFNSKVLTVFQQKYFVFCFLTFWIFPQLKTLRNNMIMENMEGIGRPTYFVSLILKKKRRRRKTKNYITYKHSVLNKCIILFHIYYLLMSRSNKS